MMTLNDKYVLVLGLGQSGLAMARWCVRQGARVRVADTRVSPPGIDGLSALNGVDLHLGKDGFDTALLSRVDCVCLSPGIDLQIPVLQVARAQGLPVYGEIDCFKSALKQADSTPEIIAITGTNGKTTVTTLVTQLCQAAGWHAVAAGNIGPSLLTAWMEIVDSNAPLPQCWVLELSSFQLEVMHDFYVSAAVVLNVSEDHLDRHGCGAAYAQVKMRIWDHARACVINRDGIDDGLMTIPADSDLHFSFGLSVPPHPHAFGVDADQGQRWLMQGKTPLSAVSDLRLQQPHHISNALAALALLSAAGIVIDSAVLTTLQQFAGLPHRTALIARRKDGTRFIDDSKGTNVGATVTALNAMSAPVVLLAGGDGKGQDFMPLLDPIRSKARAVILLGRDADALYQVLQHAEEVTFTFAADLNDAVVQANALAQAGDIVLLSPACASLDMFDNYVHRARVFASAVAQLVEVECIQ